MTATKTKSKTDFPKVVRVNAFWDGEAGVWCASSSNMHGLITEGETIPHLKEMIAEVIELFLEDEDAPTVDIVRVLLTIKQPKGNGVVVPELAAATKKLTPVFCNNSSTRPADIAPLELIIKQSFSVENGVAKL